MEYFLSNRVARTVTYAYGIFRYDSNFAVVQDIRIAGVIDNSRNVGSDEVFAFAKTDYERVILLRANNAGRIVGTHNNQRIGTFNAF